MTQRSATERAACRAASLAWVTLAAATVGFACADDGEAPGSAEPRLIPDEVGDPLTYYPQAFIRESLQMVHAVGDAQWVVEGETGARWVTTSTVVDLGGDAGAITSAVYVEGLLVVATDAGLFVWQQDELRPSPLTDLGRLPGVEQLQDAPGGELWLAAANGLHVRSDNSLWAIDIQGLDGPISAMAYGGESADGPALWVAQADRLFALARRGTGQGDSADDAWQAERETAPVAVVDLAADQLGRLWVVGEGGLLASRSASGQWRTHQAIENVVQVAARPDSSFVWVRAESGVYLFDGSAFRPIVGVSSGILASSRQGFMVAGPNGLERFVGSPQIEFVGIEEGSIVRARTRVVLRPTSPASVVSLTVELDGAPVPVDEADRSFEIDPTVLEDGRHEAVVQAVYADGQTQTVVLSFSVFAGPPPTWNDDVRPLFDEHCALCHDAQGSARLLDTSESWVDSIDTVLFNIRTGRMPLPPNPSLTLDEIALIEGWQAAGFLISRE